MNSYKQTIKRVKNNLDQSDEQFNKTSRTDIASLLDIITYLELENERLNFKIEDLESE